VLLEHHLEHLSEGEHHLTALEQTTGRRLDREDCNCSARSLYRRLKEVKEEGGHRRENGIKERCFSIMAKEKHLEARVVELFYGDKADARCFLNNTLYVPSGFI
jgi:hypothetical protein